jgi:gliding motility-associated lipoprotein GldH
MTFRRIITPPAAVAAVVLLLTCCHRRAVELTHLFPDKTWDRFQKLNFEFPVTSIKYPYDILLKITYDSTYRFRNFYINVVLDMPSGEERINEYDHDIVNKDGSPAGRREDDAMTTTFPLWRDLKFSEEGICKLEIEDLIPRTEITGIRSLHLIILRKRE